MRCTLTSDGLATRGERWRRLGAADVADTENGLRLSFPAHTEPELRKLAGLERECCAFASWEVTTEGDCAVLEITAEGEAVAAVQALFGSLRKETSERGAT
ncbi:MAG TPA: hypothetical protein VGO39_08960 [Gaiellaceae bacterium]|jgi:hypothetical protein|nr:hypothetical protein [Gaiellaceae bacterium]